MKDHWKNVEGWFTFPYLYDRMIENVGIVAHFVEVGSWKGQSAAYMAEKIIESGKAIRFDCVDTFEGSEDEDGHQTDEDVVSGKLLEVFHNNMSPFVGHYNAVKATSVDASTQYEDESLDFVFIDAQHTYEAVREDIDVWLPKVKKGGYLAGHDYNHGPVAKAVRSKLNNPLIERGDPKPHVQTWCYKKP